MCVEWRYLIRPKGNKRIILLIHIKKLHHPHPQQILKTQPIPLNPLYHFLRKQQPPILNNKQWPHQPPRVRINHDLTKLLILSSNDRYIDEFLYQTLSTQFTYTLDDVLVEDITEDGTVEGDSVATALG